MKPFTIFTDSWHYRFLKWWHVDHGHLYSRDIKSWDFCTYWRKLVLTMLSVAFRAAVVGAVIGAFAVAGFIFVRDLFIVLFTQELTPERVLSCMVLVFALAAILALFVADRKRRERIAREYSGVEATEPEQPSIVSQAYRSWRNKFCMSVEFVDRFEEK